MSKPIVKNVGKYTHSVTTQRHKLDKNINVKIATLTHINKTKMSFTEIRKISEQLMKANPTKKLMVKGLSSMGFFSLKGYDQSIDQILDEEDYVNGREQIGDYSVYKASFYLL